MELRKQTIFALVQSTARQEETEKERWSWKDQKSQVLAWKRWSSGVLCSKDYFFSLWKFLDFPFSFPNHTPSPPGTVWRWRGVGTVPVPVRETMHTKVHRSRGFLYYFSRFPSPSLGFICLSKRETTMCGSVQGTRVSVYQRRGNLLSWVVEFRKELLITFLKKSFGTTCWVSRDRWWHLRKWLPSFVLRGPLHLKNTNE